jgi:hypothetical protein
MSKKLSTGLLIASLLILSLIQISGCETQSSTLQGWQVDNGGGFYSESNGIIRLWSNGGNDSPYNGGPYIGLYKQIKPTTDFIFSVQVNAKVVEGCAINLRSSLPTGGKQEGISFEFGSYGEGVFLLARNTSNYGFNQLPFEGANLWTVNKFAYGDPNVWYTMQLNVTSAPFGITASVLDQNGTLIGSFSTSDMFNFTFEDINYIGLHVWGYSPSDFLFRNIQDSFANPASITIKTDCSSATAGSAVNVYGTLLNSNSTPLQNRIVVLSYTFSGADAWIPISSALTDEQGNYDIQWLNSASGTFTLKVEWSGDSACLSTSNTTTLSFLPYQKQQVFLVESNSTVYGLAFNNETSTLNFNVTGPSGTTGYVKATISKSLLTNAKDLQVFMDGNQLNYSMTSEVDSWAVTFYYHHSTHQIGIRLETNQSTTEFLSSDVILITIIALLGTVLAIEIKSLFGHKDKLIKN